MISEATAKRIADALERLAKHLDEWAKLPAAPPVPDIDPGIRWAVDQCRICGGNHGGLMCPQLRPVAGQLP